MARINLKHIFWIPRNICTFKIPNPNRFFSVTKIEDEQHLWVNLKEGVNKDIFMITIRRRISIMRVLGSQGNVILRDIYEDLARQGLL